jgi:predicted DNA-binding transcriptional regulator AlpA
LHDSPALGDVLHDPARLDKLDPAELPVLLGELERFRAELWRRLLSRAAATTEADDGDRLIDVDEAAGLLSVTVEHLYRHSADYPFTVKLSERRLRFSRAGLLRFIRQRVGGH